MLISGCWSLSETHMRGKSWLLRNSVIRIITRVNNGQPRSDVSSLSSLISGDLTLGSPYLERLYIAVSRNN